MKTSFIQAYITSEFKEISIRVAEYGRGKTTTSPAWRGMRMLNFILLIANLNIAQIDRSIFKPPQQLNLKIESSKIKKTAFVAHTNALIDDMLIFIRNSINKDLFNMVSTCRSNKQIIFSVQFINSFLGAFTTLVHLEVGRG